MRRLVLPTWLAWTASLAVLVTTHAHLEGDQVALLDVDAEVGAAAPVDDAKSMWEQAERLTVPVHEIEPKFKPRNGKDRAYVERIIHNAKTKDKANMLAVAQKNMDEAWKLTIAPDPPTPSFKKAGDRAEHAKKAYELVVKRKKLAKPKIDPAAVRKVIQTEHIKMLAERAKLAKASLLSAEAREGAAVANVRNQAKKDMKLVLSKAKNVAGKVKAAKTKRKLAVMAAARAIEAQRQHKLVERKDQKLQKRKIKVKATPLTPSAKEKADAAKAAAALNPKRKDKDKSTLPTSVIRAMKEIGQKNNMKVSVQAENPKNGKIKAAEKSHDQEKNALNKKLSGFSVKAAVKSATNFKKEVKAEADAPKPKTAVP